MCWYLLQLPVVNELNYYQQPIYDGPDKGQEEMASYTVNSDV